MDHFFIRLDNFDYEGNQRLLVDTARSAGVIKSCYLGIQPG
jgi:hypothetical protein